MKIRTLLLPLFIVLAACSPAVTGTSEELIDEDIASDDATGDAGTDGSGCTSVGCACTSNADCASKICGAKGTCVSCVVSNGGVEKCDGLDNNCNGQTDESTCPGDGKCLLGECDGSSNKCHMIPAPDLSSCDDGNACTIADKCSVGLCAGSLASCDDGNPCTSEDCAPAIGCQMLPVDATCTDNNACTFGDKCVDTSCTGTAKNCDDGNPCSTDTCAGGVCMAAANTATCDDSDACTTGDICKDLMCAGIANCQDGDPCTLDACDATSQQCSHTPKVGWQAPACTTCAPGFAGTACDTCSDASKTWPDC